MILRSIAVIVLLLVTSCASIRDMANSIMSLKDMQFRVVRVENMRVAGVNVSRLNNLKGLSATDAYNLLQAYHTKKLQTTFTVFVEARNPNDGSGGGKPASLTLKALPWKLYIDDRPSVSGDIRSEVAIPGGGTSDPFPLEISVDLSSVINDRGYEDLMALALSIGGLNSEPTKLIVEATPTVSTPYGVMTSPRPVRIVNTEFRAK
ncbi:MAG: hypothetical protein FGM32_00860 [Candidatus Kapabacteria bacterium]|nr:hypothetical protein [Candidatus Kapabacteria bacterium]